MMAVSCLSPFDDKSVIPGDDKVSAALGCTASVWHELRAFAEASFPLITGEWKYYGKAAGWIYKLISGKRNMLFFIPRNNGFRLRIVLGEKAAIQALAAPLPDEIKAAIRSAKAYAEGRSIDIDVDRSEQLEAVKRLLTIKYAH